MNTPLQIARKKKKLSLRALATAAGTTGAHLCNLENRKARASAEMAEKLVDALGGKLITEEQILYPERFMQQDAA